MWPPPGESAGETSPRALAPLDATQRAAPPDFPGLTLGLATLVEAAPRPRSVGDAEEGVGAAPIELRLSVMPNNSLEQLSSANVPRSAPRAPLPDLAASPRVARAPSVRRLPSEAPTVRSVVARVMPALRLIGIGVAITLVDIVYAAFNGQPFTLGPVRALWITGPLVGVGVVKLVLSLLGQ